MWQNWAGNQGSETAPVRPANVEALRALIAASAGPVRAVGAGHSFTPLIPGAGTIVDLSAMEGPVVLAQEGERVRVRAGARLHEIAAALGARELAFRNLGDINVQSIAGAMGTATHGTGAALPCLSAEMTGVTLMTAAGEIVMLAGEEIDGARASLGALGVMLEIEMTTVPAYTLRRQVRVEPVEAVIEEMHAAWAAHRHFEFFWLPWSGKALRVAHDVAEAPRGKAPVDLDNFAVKAFRAARALGRLSPALRRGLMGAILALQGEEDFAQESWRVLSKPRAVRFVEMEYHLPPENAAEVLRALIRLTEERHPEIYFPIEVRQTAGDTGWLSPFQHGNRISIAIHHAAGEDARAYFADAEPIFRAAGGRPHWGKLHSLQRADLEPLYPDLPRFDALRARLDPEGRFLTPALKAMVL